MTLDQHPSTHHAEPQALDPIAISGLITPIQTEGAVGGVNQAMIDGHERGLMISIPPYPNMQGGDWVEVFWGDEDTPVTTGSVLPEQVGGNVLMFVAAGKVPEGIHSLYCTIRRSSGNEDSSTPLPVLVRTRFPGGTDPAPELPGHQNLLPPNGIIDEEAAKAGVKVLIPGYPNMRQYDRITFFWGGVSVPYDVTQDDMDAGQVELLITEEIILEAGASDALGLLYRVRDEVHNQSTDFSLKTVIAVEVGDGLFDAPLVENPDHSADPYDVIDLEQLGDDDLLVDVIAVAGNGLLVGDLVALTWVGTSAQGQPITVTPEPRAVNKLPTVLTFVIPNADVRGLAQGRGVASYTVSRDDVLLGGSKRAFVSFTGVELGLPKPRVPDAVEGVLDPSLAQTLVVIPGEALEAGDRVYLTWLGTRANGSVLLHEDDRSVSGGGAGQPMNFTVPGQFIAPLEGGKVTVSYRLNKFSSGLDLESERESLTVGEAAAELPAPTTRPPAEDGVIDPGQLPGELVIVIAPYPDMQANQIVRLVWDASSGPHFSDWIPISPSMVGEEVEFFIDSTRLADYLGADVRLSYQVENEGEPTRISDSTAFHVGQRELVLPLPEILEAEGNELNPDQVLDGATVQIAASAELVEGDEVTVSVIGAGEDGSAEVTETVLPGQGGQALVVTIDHAVIEANRGGRFELKYAIRRKGGGEPEASGSVHYSVVSDIGDAELVIMGARFNANIFRASGTPRMLTALNKQTRLPVLAEWCHEGDDHWTASTFWVDTKPGLKLYVRSRRETWECTAVNVAGTGISSETSGLSAYAVVRDGVMGESGVETDMVAWGSGPYGALPGPALGALKNIVEITASANACSALLRDGNVAWWGYGVTSQVFPGDYELIRSNAYAFVGRKTDGELFAWGHPSYGVPVPGGIVKHLDYTDICAASSAFAAIRETGHVVAWGNKDWGGELREGQEEITGVRALLGNSGSFTALYEHEGGTSVIAWGHATYGGFAPEEIIRLKNVRRLGASTSTAHCILLESGEVRAWPYTNDSGDIPDEIAKLNTVVEVSATSYAFCARLSDGKVAVWGDSRYGGRLNQAAIDKTDFVQVVGNQKAFAGLGRDGKVVTWGGGLFGGDSSAVAGQLVDVLAIYANTTGFLALTSDGRVVTWGVPVGGGDSSKVQHELRGRVTARRLLPPGEAAALAQGTLSMRCPG